MSAFTLRKKGGEPGAGCMVLFFLIFAVVGGGILWFLLVRPMGKVIAHELEILGSHGMQAYRYPGMLAMIQSGKLSPEKLIGKTISLEQSIDALMNMDKFEASGVTVVTKF